MQRRVVDTAQGDDGPWWADLAVRPGVRRFTARSPVLPCTTSPWMITWSRPGAEARRG
jgi:hypothetical protein